MRAPPTDESGQVGGVAGRRGESDRSIGPDQVRRIAAQPGAFGLIPDVEAPQFDSEIIGGIEQCRLRLAVSVSLPVQGTRPVRNMNRHRVRSSRSATRPAGLPIVAATVQERP